MQPQTRSRIIGTCSVVASTVVAMIIPELSLWVGVPILVVCGIVALWAVYQEDWFPHFLKRRTSATAVESSGPPPEFVTLTRGSQMLYEHGGVMRGLLSQMAGADSITQTGKGFVLTAATHGLTQLRGRKEPGLPVEDINPMYPVGGIQGEGDTLVAILNEDRTLWYDVQFPTADLPVIIRHYEESDQLPPASNSREPERQKIAYLQLEEVKSSQSNHHGGIPDRSDCILKVVNTAPQDFDDCTIQVVCIKAGRGIFGVDRPLRKPHFSLSKLGGSKHLLFISRDLNNVVTPLPHMLLLEGRQWELPFDEEVRLVLELWSEYERPTKVTLLLNTMGNTVKASIESQSA